MLGLAVLFAILSVIFGFLGFAATVTWAAAKVLFWVFVALFVISLIVNVGMWLERFVIIVTSLHRDFLPSSWSMYRPTVWDFSMFLGTIGLFLSLLFLFIRFLPMISIFEIRTILPQAEVHEAGD